MAHQSCLCNFCVLKESFFWAYVTSPLDFNICSPQVNITKTFLLPFCFLLGTLFLLGIQKLFFTKKRVCFVSQTTFPIPPAFLSLFQTHSQSSSLLIPGSALNKQAIQTSQPGSG